jgi:predicted dehydrogenase
MICFLQVRAGDFCLATLRNPADLPMNTSSAQPGTSALPTRRDFIRDTARAAAAIGALSAARPLAALAAEPKRKQRLAIVGTGHRGTGMWGVPVANGFSDVVEFVGLCDINPLRAAYASSIIGSNVPTFTDFDEMVKTTRPDRVIVTTIDALHWKFVKRAMELGCDVLCEKPLCTDAKQAQAIIDICQTSGRKLDVTFNARYTSSAAKTKELLMAGEIGELYGVEYAEFLDLTHGADYFRRWHAMKANSGTLLCHKASHHFDQINWWIGSDPVEVTAVGSLRKYGRNGTFRGVNCRPCPHKSKCDFYWDITKDKRLTSLYANCESADGYLRDACVFREKIDIYDTMSAQFRYANDTLVSYTLNATVPYEGQHIVYNGSKGRIEVRNFLAQPWKIEHSAEIRLTRDYKGTVLITVDASQEGHGGADERIREMIFRPENPDPLGQRAGLRAGIMSSLMGISARTSIETGDKMRVRELVKMA